MTLCRRHGSQSYEWKALVKSLYKMCCSKIRTGKSLLLVDLFFPSSFCSDDESLPLLVSSSECPERGKSSALVEYCFIIIRMKTNQDFKSHLSAGNHWMGLHVAVRRSLCRFHRLHSLQLSLQLTIKNLSELQALAVAYRQTFSTENSSFSDPLSFVVMDVESWCSCSWPSLLSVNGIQKIC